MGTICKTGINLNNQIFADTLFRASKRWKIRLSKRKNKQSKTKITKTIAGHGQLKQKTKGKVISRIFPDLRRLPKLVTKNT